MDICNSDRMMSKRKLIALSIILHFCVLCCFMLNLHRHVTSAGDTQVIYAHLYRNVIPPHSQSEASNKLNIHFRTERLDKSNLKDNLDASKQSKQPKQQNRSAKTYAQSTKLQKIQGQTAPLLDLLHDHIQSHLVYTADIESTRQVTVKFSLAPDGYIDNIQVIKSSGTLELDQAIINAVQAIQPVAEAKQYLHQSISCTLEINFNR